MKRRNVFPPIHPVRRTCSGSNGLVRRCEYKTPAIHQVGSQASAIVHGACRDNVHRAAGEGALVAFDGIHTSWDKHGARNIARVPATLTRLCTDNVNALRQRFGDVL